MQVRLNNIIEENKNTTQIIHILGDRLIFIFNFERSGFCPLPPTMLDRREAILVIEERAISLTRAPVKLEDLTIAL
jgi:hypothetical protein